MATLGLALWLLAGGLLWGQDEASPPDGVAEEEDAVEESVAPVSPEEYLERLEWRGVLSVPEGTLFSLHDSVTGESFWIGLNEPRFGVEVVSHDRDRSSMMIAYGGASRTLSLSPSSILPLEETPAEEPPTFAGRENSRPSDGGGEEPDVEDLWLQAVAESPRLQEIDEQMQAILAAEAEVGLTLTRTEPGDPSREVAEARREELREARRRLAEMALTALQNSPNLSEETRRALADELRAENELQPDPAQQEPISDDAETELPTGEDDEILRNEE